MQAAICSRFGVSWHRYGSLTLRELGVLLDMLAEENDDDRPPSGRPRATRDAARPPRTPAPGERLERMC